MRTRMTLLRGAGVVMLAVAIMIPAAALARGGVARGGHGPVFGFHRAPIVAHRPVGPAVAHRFAGRFAHGWGLHRFARHRGNNGNGVADAGYAGSYYPAGGYGAGDTTGTVAPGPYVYAPPAGAPPEHVGCLVRGYEVVSESGGVARVRVTRC